MSAKDIPGAFYDASVRVGYVAAVVQSLCESMPGGASLHHPDLVLATVSRLADLAGAADDLLTRLKDDLGRLEEELMRR